MKEATMIIQSDSIFDAVSEKPFRGAVVLAGNHIIDVVVDGDGREYAGSDTKVLDMGEGTVCPGFLDNHVFFTGYEWGCRGHETDGAEEQSQEMKEMFSDKAAMEEAYHRFSDLLASRGVTSIKEIGFDDYSGFTETLQKLDHEGRLKHRINLVTQPVDAPMDLAQAKDWRDSLYSEFIRFMGFNLMVDGANDEHDGDMLREYLDLPGVTCNMEINYDALEEMVLNADREGFRCALHAEGDAAVRKTIDIFEKCREVNGPRDARHVITDLEMVDPEDVQRMHDLNIVASNYFQVMELYDTAEELYVESMCGADRLDRIWNYRRIADAGVVYCTGTDMPLAVPDIPNTLYLVSGRYFPDGTPEGGFQPDQGLTRAEVIRAWTIHGQYANFRDQELGTLESGKLADIAVFDCDIFKKPMAEIRDAKIVLTLCDGRIVYERNGESFS